MPTSVDEGETFSCDIDLTQNAPSGGITVSVEISDPISGTDETQDVSIDSGEDSGSFSVTAGDNTTQGVNQSITITIQTGTGYSVGNPSSDEVSVRDDETPIATITGCPTSVDEGETFSCTISLDQNAPSGGLTVSVGIGDLVASTDETQDVSIGIGERSESFSVTAGENDVEDIFPNIFITINEGTGYSLGTPSGATVGVNDDEFVDTPTASISASASSVNESDDPTITITVRMAGTGGAETDPSIDVTVEIDDSALSDTQRTDGHRAGGTDTETFDYSVTNDSVCTPGRTITFTIKDDPDADYTRP